MSPNCWWILSSKSLAMEWYPFSLIYMLNCLRVHVIYLHIAIIFSKWKCHRCLKWWQHEITSNITGLLCGESTRHCFDVFFVVNLIKLLDKRSCCWWLETLWHCNIYNVYTVTWHHCNISIYKCICIYCFGVTYVYILTYILNLHNKWTVIQWPPWPVHSSSLIVLSKCPSPTCFHGNLWSSGRTPNWPICVQMGRRPLQ